MSGLQPRSVQYMNLEFTVCYPYFRLTKKAWQKKNYKTTKRSYFLRGVNEVGCEFFAHTMSLLVHNTAFRFTKLLEIGYLSICSCNTHIDVLRDKFKIPPVSFILHHSNASLISNYCIRLSSCYEEFCMLHIGRCCPPRPE